MSEQADVTQAAPEPEPYYIPPDARAAELARREERLARLREQQARWQAAVEAGRNGWYGKVLTNPVPTPAGVAE